MNKNKYIKIVFTVLAFFSLLLSSSETYAQTGEDINVSGKVLDQNNEGIPGASVVVKGTANGTMTDIDGKFTVNCNSNDSLLISFIGYKNQTIKALSGEEIIISLQEDFVTIDAVTVVGVGYGTMRKEDLTGSISSVSNEKLKKGVISSAEQLLQGKVAGLTVVQGSGDPTAGASLRLRGGTSLSASNGPLIVVDGIPGVDFNTIQPSEIESIDVLKDASAAAIYGSRGANGVIIVTTKGKKGSQQVEYNGYMAIGTVARHLDLLSADQWRAFVRENEIDGAIDYGANTDWQKELEQTAITQSHTVAFGSSSETGGYRASLNYFDNEGVIKRSNLNRVSVNLTAHQITLDGKLRVDVGFNGNTDKWHVIDGRIYQRMYNLSPTIPVLDEDGVFTSIGGTNYENPVELNTNRESDQSRHRMLAFGKADLEIIEGLNLTANVSYEFNSHKGRLYKPTYAILEGDDDQGYAQRSLGDYRNLQLETYVTYKKIFGESHSVNLMGGYSYLDNTYEGFGAERRGFDTDLFIYNNLGAGQDYRAGDVYSYKGNAKLISFFARANYSYKGKYYFTGTLRQDGSSRFGANNKWGLFPSASLAWRISDEAFMENLSFVNNMKLRVGYGITGNQDGIGEYKSLSILGVSGAKYYDAETDTWKQSYGPIQNPNPDLKWESTAQINIGLDLTIFDSYNASIELYQKNTSDLLYTYAVPQPPYLVGTMLANVGDLSNKGIELSVDGIVMQTSKFKWSANLTLASNKQVIEKLSNQVYTTEEILTGSLHSLRGMSNQFSQVIKEGVAVGTFWGPVCTRLDENGMYVFENDGEAQDLGNVQPFLTTGIGMNFSYMNFDLNLSGYGRFGQKVLNATAMSMYDPSRLPAQNVPDDFLTSGINDVPTFSSYWIEDASFFRLQSISLGYTVNTEKLPINRLRLYVTGENLYVLTKYTGIDPEVSIDGLSSPGIDMFNYYPKPRTFSLGVNLVF